MKKTLKNLILHNLNEGLVSSDLNLGFKNLKKREVGNAVRELIVSELDAINTYSKFLAEIKGLAEEDEKYAHSVEIVEEILDDEKQHKHNLEALMGSLDKSWNKQDPKEKEETEEDLSKKPNKSAIEKILGSI
jgi:bacterioferritin (cytochrome b1)